MLNFDEQRFLRIQSGALALADDIHTTLGQLVAQGARNLFFLGSGGAGILMHPAARLLQTRSTFPVFVEMPAELVVTGSVHLGEGSIVVIPSLSGTTSESVEALEYCKARGATVLVLTGHADTPLGEQADHCFVNFAEDDTSCESFYLQSLLLALSLMHHRGEYDDYPTVLGELTTLPQLLLDVKRTFEPRAAELAAQIKDEPFHIITGAGSTWPEAFYYGMCILEEMQWIRTRPVHASDFFHGTLELVEDGVSVLVLKGEDATRPLTERVEKFAPNYTDKVCVLDAADHALPGISEDVRALVSPVLLATVLERLSAHLEVLRDHPLTTRRYYKRVAY
jgi:fructoselysine-6-phosphate deglycase